MAEIMKDFLGMSSLENPQNNHLKVINNLKVILVRLQNNEDKKRTLKVSRDKRRVTYKGMPVRPSAKFSAATMESVE